MPNRKENYSDMKKFRITRNKQRKRYYAKTARKYKNRYWTQKEDDEVLRHDISDTELSLKIHRSVSAIQSRSCMLKKDMFEKKDD